MKTKQKKTLEGSASTFMHPEGRKSCLPDAAVLFVCDHRKSFVHNLIFTGTMVNKRNGAPRFGYIMLRGGGIPELPVTRTRILPYKENFGKTTPNVPPRATERPAVTAIPGGRIPVHPWKVLIFPRKSGKHLETYNGTSGKSFVFFRTFPGFIRFVRPS
jgi:hypothetical protein